jgi:S-adenosylmethionine:tRNA ribosyltransferase-isomerase
MRITDFDYTLPAELIAQHPLERRDASRMLVVDRSNETWQDQQLAEFPTFLRRGDVVVLNNTRVFPARLVGKRMPSGGSVELFLIREIEPAVWETLSRPARRLQKGSVITFGEDILRATVLEAGDEGHRFVRFESDLPFEAALDRIGRTPLPPYIKRTEGAAETDRERYQTVFARKRGAIAAPTAGLHFTPQMMTDIGNSGISIVEITLHVGYGTFEPVRVDDLREHSVAEEHFEISESSADEINKARKNGGRVIAVGTTTTRALESVAEPDGTIRAGAGSTSLTITPGHVFRSVDALLTNFHLPCSSLLVLVSTFAGYDLTMKSYNHAVEAQYRFYSYGDCMLII